MPNDHRASPGSPGPDDRLLIRYLTGTLPDADAEPLDERSVADDEFAARLEDVENDLIDQYVRGELPDDVRRDVESHYSATPAGREKIAFARAFARQQAANPSAASSSLLDPSLPPSGPSAGPPVLEPRAASPRWLALAAGLALAATAGYFAWQNRQAPDAGTTQARVEQPAAPATGDRSLPTAPAPPAAPTNPAPANPRESGASAPERGQTPALSVALTLTPATRGVNDVVTLTRPPDNTSTAIHVQLESDDFPRYAIAIRDSATRAVIYRASGLAARGQGSPRELRVTVPPIAWQAHGYVLELSGIPSDGPNEFVTSYPFRITEP